MRIKSILRLSLLAGIVFLSCGHNKNEHPQTEQYRMFISLYQQEWDSYKITNESVRTYLHSFFSGNEYRVIWNWDTDIDGVKDYFCIIPDPVIKKGIKKGILIDEKGEIKLIFDPVKGIYTKKYFVYDFKKMGIRPQDIKCFRLLFKPEEVKASKYYLEQERKNKPNGILHHTFCFQLVDKNNNLFGIVGGSSDDRNLKFSCYFIDKIIFLQSSLVKWAIFNPHGTAENVIYNGYRQWFPQYRASTNKIKVYNK